MAPSSFRGARVKRIEDPPLLSGRGKYVDDLAPAGLSHAAVVRSPHAHAKIRSIKAPAAVDLVTARDLGDPLWLPGDIWGSKTAVAHHPALAIDRVCYVGQPVALVLAPSVSEAADAADRVRVEYEPLQAVVDPEEALRPDAPRLHPDLPSNVAYREHWRRGSPRRAFARAAVTITQRIRHQRLAPTPLETRGVLALPPQGSERTFTVWSSTQAPHELRDELMERLPLAGATVRVVAPDVGGAFGAKGNIYPEEILIPYLALRLGRPLKWVETRRENLIAMSQGRGQFADVGMAASQTGRILAVQLRVVADVGAYILATTAIVPTFTLLMAQGPYDIPSVEVELEEVYTNKVPTGAYRGAGRPEATFYLERAIDILAAELGMDPAEIRRRNFIRADQFPYRATSGVTYDSGNYTAALDRALDAADYSGWRVRQAKARQEKRHIGVGLSSYVEMATYGSDTCRLELDSGGKVTLFTGTSPHGQGTATGLAQIVADVLGVDVLDVSVIHGDTALIRDGEGTSGSRTLVVGGSAAFRAAKALRRKILQRAATMLEARVDDLTLSGGRTYVRGSPSRGISLGDVAAASRRRQIAASGRFAVGEDGTFPFGTHVAVVEIDPETGEVHMLQNVAAVDFGVVINPLLVEGQVQGGVAQAIGQALYEEVVYDASGQPLTATLLDYAIPQARMVPPVVMARTETSSPRNPLGAKGAGEAGTTGATPAVANAVLDALAPSGVRHLDMPLTPLKIWAAIHGSKR